jgi:single-strand DNA-binding protein
MAAQNINVVVITGNLTKDPEENQYGDTYVCEMRVAVNSRRKQGEEWVDKPNYFDVTVFGGQGKNCKQYLKKGRPVAVEGRLDWREWDAKDGSGKRQAVQIIADSVQFLGSKDGASSNGNGASSNGNGQLSTSDAPAEEPVAAAAGGGGDDDIPF